MKIYKKIAVGLLSTIVVLICLNFVLDIWISAKLKSILTQKNTASFVVKYKNLDTSLFTNSISVDEISFIPKENTSDSLAKTKISGTIKLVKVTHIGVLGILFKDKITANNIIISNPKITFLTNKKPDKKEQDEAVKSLEKTFSISNIYLKNAEIKIINDASKKVLLSVHNLNVSLDEIGLSDKTIAEKIPFSYKSYSVDCDSIFYHQNEFYNIKSNKITASDSELKISDFKLIPLYSRKQFASKIATEKDLYAISSKEISVDKMKWGFKDTIFFFETQSVLLDKVSATIYRSKEPKDDLSKKKLYNNLLRNLKFNLKVDTLKVRNSTLIYEEEITFEKGPGKLYFDNFNLTATTIESGFKKTKLPDLKIKINCQFMKTSPLNVNWRLNVMDKTDGFRIQGNIANFDLEKLNPFTKPYINVKTKGIFNKVVFDFTGNDISSTGKFALEYDDLKVEIFKKDDRKKKNKLLTAIGNLFVKNDTKDQLKDTDVAVERIQEKSFYNFLWLNIAEGLKKLLI